MMPGRAVLIVEDDAIQRETLIESLRAGREFDITAVASLQEADACLDREDIPFDAIILDLWLADGSGCNWCIKLRQAGYQTPIIIAMGVCEDATVVRCFEAGANDYMYKPFTITELVARLRAQLQLGLDRSATEPRSPLALCAQDARYEISAADTL